MPVVPVHSVAPIADARLPARQVADDPRDWAKQPPSLGRTRRPRMVTPRMGVRALGALLLLAGASAAWAANPTPEDLLKIRPKLDGIEISTPSEEQIPNCKVEVIKG